MVQKVRSMSNIVLNKLARRPPRVIVQKVVILYQCMDKGREHQYWAMDLNEVVKEGDSFTFTIGFDAFEQHYD